ncbi:MAG: signal peptidase I [Candidatus Saccharimonadales bacterium]|jgi:signal peptidase I
MPPENTPEDKPDIELSPAAEEAFLAVDAANDTGVPTEDDDISAEDDDSEYTESGFSTYTSLYGRTVAVILASLFSVFFIFNFMIKTYVVDGSSMFPALADKDRLVLWATGKSFSDLTRQDHIPKRGEVVVIGKSDSDSVEYVKRVIGLPGERVELTNGKFTITNDDRPNGFNPDEELGLDLRSSEGDVDIVIPEGHIFVVGDNREPSGSLDSRNGLGPLPVDRIKGTVMLRFLPFYDFKIF